MEKILCISNSSDIKFFYANKKHKDYVCAKELTLGNCFQISKFPNNEGNLIFGFLNFCTCSIILQFSLSLPFLW